MISIHVPREGDDRYSRPRPATALAISIHVPREGDDRRCLMSTGTAMRISIHVPREGDDLGRVARQLYRT